MARVYCPRCRRCACRKCHAEDSCLDRGRRFFLLGALAAPLAQKVTLPAPAQVGLFVPRGSIIETDGTIWTFEGIQSGAGHFFFVTAGGKLI